MPDKNRHEAILGDKCPGEFKDTILKVSLSKLTDNVKELLLIVLVES